MSPIRVALFCVAVLIVRAGIARAQIFPSEDLTKAFEERLGAIAERQGSAFVASCAGPGNHDKAILVVPVGSDHGTLALVASGKVYNGGGVVIEKGGIAIEDGGGGEWSLRKLNFFAEKLGAMKFHLESGATLRNLLRANPTTRCPLFDL